MRFDLVLPVTVRVHREPLFTAAGLGDDAGGGPFA